MSKQVRVTLQTKEGPVRMELSDESMLETALTFPDWTRALIERGQGLDETPRSNGGGSLEGSVRASRIAHADMKSKKRRGAMLALLRHVQEHGSVSRIEAVAFLKKWGARSPWSTVPMAISAGYMIDRDGRAFLTKKGAARASDDRLTAMPRGR